MTTEDKAPCSHHTLDIAAIERGGYPHWVMTCHHDVEAEDPDGLYAPWVLDGDCCWFKRLWDVEGGPEWLEDIDGPIRFPLPVRPSGFYEEMGIVRDERRNDDH